MTGLSASSVGAAIGRPPEAAAPRNAKCKMQNAKWDKTGVLPPAWDELLDHPFDRKPHRATLAAAEAAARGETVYPPREDWFAALELTPPERVRAVILGQDPYHEPDQAMGLAFSVRPGVKLPPSLRNIYKELETDLGRPAPKSGDLTPWAEQGVLLLNTVLTVAAGRANSHKALGWQQFTGELLAAVARLPQPIAFVLWGEPAKRAYERAMQNEGSGIRDQGSGDENAVGAVIGRPPEAAASKMQNAKCKMQNEGSGIRDQGSGDGGCGSFDSAALRSGRQIRDAGSNTGDGSLCSGTQRTVPCVVGPRLILEAPHPSPLSAYRGFFGSRPFSQINDFLTAHGENPIRWND